MVHVVGGHYFVLESLPEILVSVFMRRTLKYVDVLNGDFIGHGVHFEFESGKVILLRLRLLRVRIEQIVDFLVVKLDILNLDSDLALAIRLSSLGLNLTKEFTDSSWYHAFFLHGLDHVCCRVLVLL